VTDLFYFHQYFWLRTFAIASCVLQVLILVVAAFITGLTESGVVADKYDMRHPLTQTAVVWMPHANVSVAPRVPGATCDLYDSREFYTPRPYVQTVVFEYSELPERYLLTIALFVSTVFQLVTVVSERMYLEPFMVGNSHVTGYLDRSISFPLLVVVLSLHVGISDVMVVLGFMFAAWAAMLFSFFAEILFQGDGGFLAIGPGAYNRERTGDSVKQDGGIWAWGDGNIHYHALSMLFALGNFGFVAAGLVYSFFLTDNCFTVRPSFPDGVKPLVYSSLVFYGLVLFVQAFVAYMKPKPSTIQRRREYLISCWKEEKTYKAGDDFNVKQEEKLMEGLLERVRYALMTEFINGVSDLGVKGLFIACFFLFKRD